MNNPISTSSIGLLMLAIYLIVLGVFGLVGVLVPYVLPILALISGIFLLIGR